MPIVAFYFCRIYYCSPGPLQAFMYKNDRETDRSSPPDRLEAGHNLIRPFDFMRLFYYSIS
jgi:hypothetical protein